MRGERRRRAGSAPLPPRSWMPSAVPPPTRKAWAGGSLRKCRPFRSGRKPIPGFLSPSSAPSVTRGEKAFPHLMEELLPPFRRNKGNVREGSRVEHGRLGHRQPRQGLGPHRKRQESPSGTGTHRNSSAVFLHSWKSLRPCGRGRNVRPPSLLYTPLPGNKRRGRPSRPLSQHTAAAHHSTPQHLTPGL